MLKSFNKKYVPHYPNLDTVLMVEEFIHKHSGEYKKKALWMHLPKKMMYQTFCIILSYLIDSNKIVVDKEGWVIWIWDPEGVKYFMEHKELSWQK